MSKKLPFKNFLEDWDKTTITKTFMMIPMMGLPAEVVNMNDSTARLIETTMEFMGKERIKLMSVYVDWKQKKLKRLIKKCEKGTPRYNMLVGAYLALNSALCEWKGWENKTTLYELEKRLG